MKKPDFFARILVRIATALTALLVLLSLAGCKPLAETAIFSTEDFTLTLGVVHRGYVGPDNESHYAFMTTVAGNYNVTIAKHDEAITLDCPIIADYDVFFPAPSFVYMLVGLPATTMINLNIRTTGSGFQIFEFLVN